MYSAFCICVEQSLKQPILFKTHVTSNPLYLYFLLGSTDRTSFDYSVFSKVNTGGHCTSVSGNTKNMTDYSFYYTYKSIA